VYDEKDDPIAVKALVYTPGEIDYVYDYSKAIYVNDIRLDLKNAEVEYKGIASKFDDLEAGQKIYYIYYRGSTTPKIAPHAIIEVVGETVTGVLERVAYNADGDVISLVVEGKTYSAITGGLKPADFSDDFIGKEVNLYLDRDGKVFKVELVKAPIADWFVGLIIGRSQDVSGKYVTIFTEEDYEITVAYVYSDEVKVNQAVYAKIYGDGKIYFAGAAADPDTDGRPKSVAVAAYAYQNQVKGLVTKVVGDAVYVKYPVSGAIYKEFVFSAKDAVWLQAVTGGYEVRPVQAQKGDNVKVYVPESSTNTPYDGRIMLGIVY